MPPTTALRRVSTLVVGALFAVVFVCSGVSAVQPATPHSDAVVSAHTATSKVAVRSAHQSVKIVPAPILLASTGPVSEDLPATYDVPVDTAVSTGHVPVPTFTASERAPPAL